LKNAHIKESLINSAIIDFVTYVMLNRDLKKSKRACAKDSNIVLHTEYLHRLFPNSKIIYVVRDGRAAAYSHMVCIIYARF
jgi:protein-tyrosine sulfotransferase